MSAENELQLVQFIKFYDLYIVSIMLSDKDRTEKCGTCAIFNLIFI